MKIFIDIETIPTQSSDHMTAILEGIKPPANYTKPETIDKWMRENAELEAEKQWRKTALSGTSGEIVVIGWAVKDGGEVRTVQRGPGENEHNLLVAFWDGIEEDVYANWIGRSAPPAASEIKVEWVGHNVEFDVRFLWQRSVVHRIRPPLDIRPNERHGYGHLFCTMQAWAGHREYVKLEALCKALGVDSPKDGGMDGSRVYDAWIEGRIGEIADYCAMDVEAMRLCYRKMTFAEAA